MQLDHVSLFVRDVARSRTFYEALLPGEGLALNRDFGQLAVGFGDKDYAVLALIRQEGPIQATHLAFRLESRSKVRELYERAIRAGGVDNGPPGERPQYTAHYYAAFIRDPDGHNLEFVCHRELS
ncbi:MAG: VOC family protein [Pseudomonadota bacterium]